MRIYLYLKASKRIQLVSQKRFIFPLTTKGKNFHHWFLFPGQLTNADVVNAFLRLVEQQSFAGKSPAVC